MLIAHASSYVNINSHGILFNILILNENLFLTGSS